MYKAYALLLVFLISFSSFATSYDKNLSKSYEITDMVQDEILVKFKQGRKSHFYAKTNLSSSALKEEFQTGFGEFALIKVDSNKMQKNLDDLNKDSNLEYAEPNYIYKAIGVKNYNHYNNLYSSSNDPMFQDLWGLSNTGDNEPESRGTNSSPRGIAGADINAIRAWNITKGDKKIKIAVIDTGIDYNHPDLVDNMWINQAELHGTPGVDDDGNGFVDDVYGYDFANNDGDPMDGNGHGTHCAGTIAASHNNIGIAGVMKDASLVGIKFLTDQGSGSSADAIRAIDYATKLGVDIMSNSWGGGGASQALEDAIIRAKDAGIIFTAAAGNSATDNNSIPHYPSNYNVENVISVASHTYN